MAAIEEAIAMIECIRDEYCENQVYIFDDFDAENFDATGLCERLGVPFTDDLFIRYPVNRTFRPKSLEAILAEEQQLGAFLPADYKTLLTTFGEFHLPGREVFTLMGPKEAAHISRVAWGFKDPLPALAISPFHRTSDGNSLGYLRNGSNFGPEIVEFQHDLRYSADYPNSWTKRLAGSLAEFLIDYIRRK